MIRTIGEVSSYNALREKDCNIQEHLKSHVHLTNCIHLKNHVHMQKSKAMSAESSLIRDLILLQRSKSLRDPSTSPSWNSPIGSLMKRLENKGIGYRKDHDGEKSSMRHLRHEPRRGVGSSPLSQSNSIRRKEKCSGSRKFSSGRKRNNAGRKDRALTNNEDHRIMREMTRLGHASETERPLKYAVDSGDELKGNLYEDSFTKTKKISRRKNSEVNKDQARQLSKSCKRRTFHSCEHQSRSAHGRYVQKEEAYSSSGAEGNGRITSTTNHRAGTKEPNRFRKRKSNGLKQPRMNADSKETPGVSVSSNSLIHGSSRIKELSGSQGTALQLGGNELGITQTPKNGCGIPWNWSRIHQRGKTILDRAGRSLSCGLSDSATRKMDGLGCQSNIDSHSDPSVVPGTPDNSSSLDSDSEAVPLLNEPCASQESLERDVGGVELSGELGIYADHNFNFSHDYASPSENRARARNEHERELEDNGYLRSNGRHLSLTQKYAPRTFDELIGQNLVVQALKNAIQKRKIGMVYVFYGPHGTGKTSCARIFAAALNCCSSHSNKPCGSCGTCLSEQTAKNSLVKEIASVANVSYENISDLVGVLILTSSSSRFHYKVLIVDDCQTFTDEAWKAISKILDQVPQNIVCILIATSLDQIPHMIITRSQKFFFPKLKDTDVINKLQSIALKEELEIDKDALKLIASKSDGSLRDAEMTLDQLSLLGQNISLPLVQELVGLIPDDKLLDLLDLALSADTINIVKYLRELIDAGVEPLALMSQLATLITDILAGCYSFPEGYHRKFFQQETLSKEKMERLRQALKTLSEAEKQLRLSSDRTTWLTATLLQLAPDHSYIRPYSSTGTSCSQSPLVQNDTSERESHVKIDHQNEHCQKTHRKAHNTNKENVPSKHSEDSCPPKSSIKEKGESSTLVYGGRRHDGDLRSTMDINSTKPLKSSTYFVDINAAGKKQFICRSPSKLEEIWERVLDKVNSVTLKNFMQAKGKLYSVSFGAVPMAKLTFQNQEDKAIADRSKAMISHAFKSALGCPVEVQLDVVTANGGHNNSQLKVSSECDISNCSKTMQRLHPNSPENASQRGMTLSHRIIQDPSSEDNHLRKKDNLTEEPNSEIIECFDELSASHNLGGGQYKAEAIHWKNRERERQGQFAPYLSTFGPYRPDKHGNTSEYSRRQAIVKGKVSLGHVIRHTDFDLSQSQLCRSSRRKGMSIAEKLEQENLRLESRSGGLLCWRAARVTRKKRKHYRTRMRKSRFLLRLVICARCPCIKKFR